MSSLNGANVLVTRPGAGSAHAHDTNPEQSERYGSQSGTSGRSHVELHAESLSGSWFAAWQYGTIASTHSCARAMLATTGVPASGSVPVAIGPSVPSTEPV